MENGGVKREWFLIHSRIILARARAFSKTELYNEATRYASYPEWNTTVLT